MASRAWLMRSRGWLTPLLAALVGCYQGVTSSRDDGVAADTDEGDTEGDPEEDDAVLLPPQPLHRLNRLEYNNTVRDLLGTTLRPADNFNPDPVANGFDNMAEQLGLTPSHFHGYSTAALEVIENALSDKPLYSVFRTADNLGATGGYPVGELWALSGHPVVADIDVPDGLTYELVFVAGASRVGTAPQPTVAIEVDGAVVMSFEVRGSAAHLESYVIPLGLPAGAHTVRVVPTNFVNLPAEDTSNNVIVSSFEVRSVEMGDGPGRSLVYVCDPNVGDARGCYEQIIERFAFRAWRRPVTQSELEPLLQLFEQVRGEGESEDDALRLVMRAIMSSPKFLYRARTSADADDGEWLDDFVLASRLSYFLWSSMPDERLFEAASQGRLSTPEGLSEAVAWMLEDEKAQGLSDGFAEQWLSTRTLDSASPSPEVYPEFDEALRAAMVEESKLFFRDFLNNGLPVAALLEPPFAYRNDRLAEHYGMPPADSAQIVRVEVAPEERRGLLSLGAWLIAQSESDHSSPILRGVWVSDRILCTPVPSPPPGLEIEPIPLGGDEPIRDQLERHRSDPQCAACHQLLDVLGMGFEEFDGIGRQLSYEGLDTLGELPDGRTFEGAAEFSALLRDNDAFVGCVAEKLFTYALGRSVTPLDGPHLQQIRETAVAGSFGMPQLIDAIVHAPPFRSPASLEGQ